MATAISPNPVATNGGLSFVVREPLPGLVQLLSQGATVGVLIYFGLVLVITFTTIDYYKVLILGALPGYLGFGAVLGSMGGLAVWCATRLWKDRLPALFRFPIAAFGVSLGHVIWWLISPTPTWDFVFTERFISLLALTVLGIGLISGTQLHPARALGHGLWRINPRQPLLATVAAFALRKALVFGCLEFMLFLFCAFLLNSKTKVLLHCVLDLAYFLGSLVITFANPNLWTASMVGLIFNLPWIALLTYINEFNWGVYFIITVVSLWGAFILTRTKTLYTILSFIFEELRYYLID